MKEILIRYNTYDEYNKSKERAHIQVLIDGKPIERLRHFSIEVDPKGFEPEYTVKQYMDFPDNEEYCF